MSRSRDYFIINTWKRPGRIFPFQQYRDSKTQLGGTANGQVKRFDSYVRYW